MANTMQDILAAASAADSCEIHGHSIGVRYTYALPDAPPASGSSWETWLDFPAIKLTLMLPSDPEHRYLADELRDYDVSVLGESLRPSWGTFDESSARYACISFSRVTFTESLAAAMAAGKAAIESVRRVLDARAGRLSERDRTIAEWDDSAPAPVTAIVTGWDFTSRREDIDIEAILCRAEERGLCETYVTIGSCTRTFVRYSIWNEATRLGFKAPEWEQALWRNDRIGVRYRTDHWFAANRGEDEGDHKPRKYDWRMLPIDAPGFAAALAAHKAEQIRVVVDGVSSTDES